jgi:hypothetical protein
MLVLKNVGKVERFVVDLLRRIVDEDLVFPCYSSVDLIKSGPDEEDENDQHEHANHAEERLDGAPGSHPMDGNYQSDYYHLITLLMNLL